MYRRVPPMLRVGRALTALFTVWCLGCSGFEPLLNTLFGFNDASGMACADDATMRGEPSMVDGSSLPTNVATVSAPFDAHGGFDCGCAQSCQAVSLSGPVVAPRPDPMPHVASLDVTQPPSVERAPLLPPPELTTA